MSNKCKRVTARQVEVMQAYINGEKIQVACKRHARRELNGIWNNTSTPIWDWCDYDYRIKPKPIKIWINLYPSGTMVHYDSKREALKAVLKSDQLDEIETYSICGEEL